MNIYLDESYNLQKERGTLCLTINGFAVLDDRTLRKRWKRIRKRYRGKRRIHATDSRFEPLRRKSIKLLGRHDVTILTVFQLVQELPYRYFDKNGMQFDVVYSDLLKLLFKELSLREYREVRIIVDSRKHRGGVLGTAAFQSGIEKFLKETFSATRCHFIFSPSYMDVLVELADFVSNTFYREYQRESGHVFSELGFRLIQIKNPLTKADL